jgi:hypothetical protein
MATNNKINKIVNYVYATRDYTQFKLSDLNREVKEKAVKTLMDSIKISGQRQPILVDIDNYVYDGQHRLEACKRLGIAVRFIVDKHIKDEAIQQLNANQKAWTLLNHVEFFCKKGNRDYLALLELKKSTVINITVLAGMLSGYQISSGGHTSDKLKAGEFKVRKYESVKKFLDDFNQLNKVSPNNKGSLDPYVAAVWELWKCKKFDMKRFLIKNSNLPDQAQGVRDKNVLLRYILENYNSGFKSDSPNKVNYFFDDKKNIIITDPERKI